MAENTNNISNHVIVGDLTLSNNTHTTGIITTCTISTNAYPAPYYTGDIIPYNGYPKTVLWYGRSLVEKILIKEKENVIPMKKLYKVYVVSLDEEILLGDKLVVAEDTKDAEFAAGIFDVLKKQNLKPKDVTVICEVLGDVKVREEIKKVKIVKED